MMKSLRAGPAVATVGVTLIPIEWIEITAQRDGGHAWWQVTKEPVAVVICEAGGVRMLDANGAPLSLEEWLPRVDGLEASLAVCGPQ
jgi:hypothetical protein